MNITNVSTNLSSVKRDYYKGLNLIKFGHNLAFWGLKLVDVIKSGGNPVTNLISDIYVFSVQALCSQLVTSGYVQHGKISGTTFRTGSEGSNQKLISSLTSNAKKLGISGRVSIRCASMMIGHPNLMESNAISLFQEISITCHPALFYSQEVKQIAIELTDEPVDKQLCSTLVSHPEYEEFIGASMLSLIQMNAPVYTKISKFVVSFFSKSIIDHVCKNRNMNTAAFGYQIAAGITVSLISYTAERLISRYFTAKADKRAVELTQDPKAAIACLQFIKELSPNENSRFLEPSYDQRIAWIDPDQQFSSEIAQASHPFEEPISDELLTRKIEFYEETQPVKIIRGSKNISVMVSNNLPLAKDMIFSLGWELGLAWLYGHSPTNGLFFSFLSLLPIHLFPNQLEEVKSQYWSRSSENSRAQTKLSYLAKEMGITKPIIARSDASYETNCRAQGTAYGPGNAIVYVSKNESEDNEFVLRHELSHIAKGDTLTISAVSIITIFAAKTLLASKEPSLLKGILIKVCEYGVRFFVTRWIEARADRNALESSKDKQAVASAGIQFFKSTQEKNIALRNDESQPLLETMKRKFFITKLGEIRFDEHPSLQSRIAELEKLA